MALPPIPPIPPAVRGPDFISAFVSPAIPQSSSAMFNRIVDTARATSGPLPTQGLENVVRQPDIVSLLDRSLFRDLVSNFEGINGVTALPQSDASVFSGLGIDSLLGRTGLPLSLRGLDDQQAMALATSASNYLNAIQAFGGGDSAGPGIGALLDISA
jgi:hypothetical protein